MTDYFKLLNESWSLLRKNPVLLLPLLISFLLLVGFIIFILIQLIIVFASAGFSAFYSPKEILMRLISFWPVLLIIAIADFFVLLAITAYVRAMQIGAYRDVVLQKKITPEKIFSYGKEYFKKYFFVNLLRLLLFLPAIIIFIAFLIAFAAFVFKLEIFSATFLAVTFLLFIFAIIYAAILAFLLYFLDPVFSHQKLSERLSPWEIIKTSFNYTKNNLGHVLLTWLVTLLVSVIVSVALFILYLPVASLQFFSSSAYIPARILVELIQWIVSAILAVLLDLFIFSCYFRK